MQETRRVSFQQIDKSNFFCLKFKNNSYYFGEIAYLDSEGVLVRQFLKNSLKTLKISQYLDNPNEIVASHEDPPANLNPKDGKPQKIPEKPAQTQIESKVFKKVRHGFGVQVFGGVESDDLRKYEGQWDKDKRNGQGTCVYSDGSCYIGGFLNDLREGFAKMTWEEGWEYEGYWKEGRLHGKGTFKTLEVRIFLRIS